MKNNKTLIFLFVLLISTTSFTCKKAKILIIGDSISNGFTPYRDKINGTITFNLEKYESQLDALVKIILEKSDAKLIFFTTTYVPDHEAGRFAEDAKKYNNIARSVMKANGVRINDIYMVSKRIHFDYGKGNDDVHFTPKGYEALAQHVSDFLKQEIKWISKN